ncbi:chromosome partitioning protein [Arcicella aurantiaca]|uniref:Chromosome partitioning protein n=1 Tax=Arcicella aurantiaca TaxID=591202 RepID=A0A316DPZ5_9BACT|nr:AAA family ATPase [Arcicella aurantiaca]PWK20044.1 chromosome partitioning protein [Arcicella aurantiaca]
MTQELALKFIRHNPALLVSSLEKEAGIPRQTITRALNENRAIPEKHLELLFSILTKYGYSPTLYQNARVISVVNHKGGVGKTTTTASLGEALSKKGFKVLLIDLDPQGNLSQILGVDMPEVQVADSLIDNVEFPVVKIDDNLDLSPSDIDLANVEMRFHELTGGEFRLKNRIAHLLAKYDYIVIDCPPSLNKLTLSAMAASTSCIIPLLPEMSAVKGLNSIWGKIMEVRKDLNASLQIDGVVFTMVKKNTVHDGIKNYVKEEVKNIKIFDAEIKHLIDFQKSQIAQNSISKFSQDSEAAKCYWEFCDEYISYLQIVK